MLAASQYSPEVCPAQDPTDAEHLQTLLAASQYSPVVSPAQDATEAEHLQTLLAASQYAPVVKPEHDVDVPHLQASLTQVSPDTLHAATVEEHLQTPFPLFAVLSQYSPVACPEQELRTEVHLQMPLPPLAEASQYSPVDCPAQVAREAVHLQILLGASQYAPVVKPEQEADVPHLQTPKMQVSPDMLHVIPSHGLTKNLKKKFLMFPF